jgi:hypothetical protein
MQMRSLRIISTIACLDDDFWPLKRNLCLITQVDIGLYSVKDHLKIINANFHDWNES